MILKIRADTPGDWWFYSNIVRVKTSHVQVNETADMDYRLIVGIQIANEDNDGEILCVGVLFDNNTEDLFIVGTDAYLLNDTGGTIERLG